MLTFEPLRILHTYYSLCKCFFDHPLNEEFGHIKNSDLSWDWSDVFVVLGPQYSKNLFPEVVRIRTECASNDKNINLN